MNIKEKIVDKIAKKYFCDLFTMFGIHKQNFSDMTYDKFQVLLGELVKEKRLIQEQNANGLTYWEVVKC